MKNLLVLIITFSFVSTLSADPCNGNGKGGGNKCGLTEEETQELIDDSISDVNADINKTETQIGGVSTEVNSLKFHAEQTDRRLDILEESKWFLDTSVRVGSSKYLDIELYNQYDWRHSRNYAFGMKFIFKPGKSYEEKLIERQERQIQILKILLIKTLSSSGISINMDNLIVVEERD